MPNEIDTATATATIELPIGIVKALKAEARAHRKPIADFMLDWLQDQADIRAIKKADQASKGKPQVKAEDLYRQCGL